MNANEVNNKVVERVKNARNEREKTQQDLATELNKTRAAISDMERGKVQISAGELYVIAKLLDKPIEYFYGEDFGGKEVEDIIAVTRLQSPEHKLSTIEIAKLMMKLQGIGKKAQKYKKGKDIPDELIQEFYNTFIPFSKLINEIAMMAKELQKQFDEELTIRRIKPTDNK
ncbi:MAG: XRE family transcriptional regulator [Anaerolineaceae bacterium]|nr:MAG: XRE family transcriptional regulator [Anaerolineaceae bacterium]